MAACVRLLEEARAGQSSSRCLVKLMPLERIVFGGDLGMLQQELKALLKERGVLDVGVDVGVGEEGEKEKEEGDEAKAAAPAAAEAEAAVEEPRPTVSGACTGGRSGQRLSSDKPHVHATHPPRHST